MVKTMIYIFGITIIYTLIRQRDKLLKSKRNLILYLILSIIGMTMGIIYMINPYLPSISSMMEKYME
jgi:multisubunit Na+/H+ antiporter MnhB subunit